MGSGVYVTDGANAQRGRDAAAGRLGAVRADPRALADRVANARRSPRSTATKAQLRAIEEALDAMDADARRTASDAARRPTALFHLRIAEATATARWRSSCRRSGTSAPARSSCASSTTSTRPRSGQVADHSEHRDIVRARSRAMTRPRARAAMRRTWTTPRKRFSTSWDKSKEDQMTAPRQHGSRSSTRTRPEAGRVRRSTTSRSTSRIYRFEDWVVVRYLLGRSRCVIFYQFFTRYALNDSASWTEEIARYLLICVTCSWARRSTCARTTTSTSTSSTACCRAGLTRAHAHAGRRRCASPFSATASGSRPAHAEDRRLSAWRSSTGRSGSSTASCCSASR